MTESHDDLWQELSEMADAYAETGRRLVHAGRELITPGLVPEGELLESVEQLRARFEALRIRTYDSAGMYARELPPMETVRSLKELAILLERVIEIQIQHSVLEEPETLAMTIAEENRTYPLTVVTTELEQSSACEEGGEPWSLVSADPHVVPVGEQSEVCPAALQPEMTCEDRDAWVLIEAASRLETPAPMFAETEQSNEATGQVVLAEEPIASPQPSDETDAAFATLTSDALLTTVVAEALPFIPYRQTVPLPTRAKDSYRTAAMPGWRVWNRFNFSAGGR
jgi:hypothetical protein